MPKELRTAFISYTRRGGAAVAERLRTLLTNNGIRPWQDRTHLRGGDDFWERIEEAIRRCSYLVMVVTPDAFSEERRVLRREWYTARSAGTCVVPVKGSADMCFDSEALPRWLKSRHIVDLDHADEVTSLIEHLQSACTVERVPFMAADLPENFTTRTIPTEAAVERLLRGEEGNVAVTTALRGAGGFGKTLLAQAICHDNRVIESFEHGILWVTLGERPRILEKVAALFTALTDESRTFSDEDAARAELAERLRSKRCLIVLDDVWDYADLAPFLDGGRASVRLITTRQSSIIAQTDAFGVRVDEMTTAEAADMLAASLPQVGLERELLTDVAQQLGEWPLLLNLFIGHVRESMQYGQAAVEAVADLRAEFAKSGPTAFDRANSSDRRQAVDVTLGVSLKRLSVEELARCCELSIFPEDTPVPLASVSDLWQTTDPDTLRSAKRLADLALVTLDLATRSIALHDVIRDYLSRSLERPAAEVHARLVEAWPDPARLPHDYARRWGAYHLSKTDREDLRLRWTEPKRLATRLEQDGLAALIDDFDYLGERDVLRLVQSALVMDARALFADPSLLATQLLSRLGRGVDPLIDRLIDAITGVTSGPWLRPLSILHPPGGALVSVLRGYKDGHTGTVRSMAMDEHGRWIVTAGNSTEDQTVKIWNLRSGSHRTLPGLAEPGGRTPLAITSDGTRVLVGFATQLKLVETTEAQELRVHSGDERVSAVALSRDGRTAAWGTVDGAVWAWTFAEKPVLLGRHDGAIHAVDLSRDAGIAASVDEDEVALWDLHKQRRIDSVRGAAFVSHNFSRCFRLAADGAVVWSGLSYVESSDDGSRTLGPTVLKRWQPTDPDIRMSRLADVSAYLAVSQDGRRTLVMRRGPDSSEELALYEIGDAPRQIELPKLGRSVSTAVISGDFRWAATADYEHDFFVWNLDRALDPLSQPDPPPWSNMEFVGFATSGRHAVFQASGVVTVIDVETGLKVRTDDVPDVWREPLGSDNVAAARARGKRSATRPVRRVTAKTSANDFPVDDFGRSRGHSATVHERRRAPNGRWEATVSHDGTARIWDLAGERLLAMLTCDSALKQCHWSPDSRTLAVVESPPRTHLLRLQGV